jgi:hypothetical protein
MSQQQPLFADPGPPIGSRWLVKAQDKRAQDRTFELDRIDESDPVYRYILRLVDGADTLPNGYRVGHEISVELAWFELRARRVQ